MSFLGEVSKPRLTGKACMWWHFCKITLRCNSCMIHDTFKDKCHASCSKSMLS